MGIINDRGLAIKAIQKVKPHSRIHEMEKGNPPIYRVGCSVRP